MSYPVADLEPGVPALPRRLPPQLSAGQVGSEATPIPDSLLALAADIDACIAANETAKADRAGRYILDGLSDQLRRYRVALSKMNTEGALLYFGPNWHGPAVADLIQQSNWHRTTKPYVSPQALARATGDEAAIGEQGDEDAPHAPSMLAIAFGVLLFAGVALFLAWLDVSAWEAVQ